MHAKYSSTPDKIYAQVASQPEEGMNIQHDFCAY